MKDTDSAVGVVRELEAEIADEVEGVCAWEIAGLWLIEDLFVFKFVFERDDRNDWGRLEVGWGSDSEYTPVRLGSRSESE